MGKKRIVKKSGTASEGVRRSTSAVRLSRKKLDRGTLHVQSTYNNTKLLLADKDGKAVSWSSSGALGFKGAKKGTPFAAAKVGELLGERAKLLGLREIDVIIRGVGSGRESSIRAFVSKGGVVITSMRDRTPIPFNGPKKPKPRRV
jgi:small subunit ribosomal protein S11